MMGSELIGSVITSAVPYGLREIIPSTMGEPLLYPHFDEFVEQAIKHDIRINLTTNGTFPGKGVDGWGKEILPVASDVKISMNSADQEQNESIMHGIQHNEQIRNLQRFIEIRDDVRSEGRNYPTITLQVTFMENNVEDLPDLIKMAIEMGVDRVKGHHLWVTWPELEQQSLRRSNDSRLRWNKNVREVNLIAGMETLPDGSLIKLDNFISLPDNGKDCRIPKEWTCPFAGREAWIAWDGTFNVCCCPDQTRKDFGYFGNVKENDFIDLWRGKNYQDFIQEWGNYEACEVCNMRRPAGGSS